MCGLRRFCGYWAEYVMVDEGSEKCAVGSILEERVCVCTVGWLYR